MQLGLQLAFPSMRRHLKYTLMEKRNRQLLCVEEKIQIKLSSETISDDQLSSRYMAFLAVQLN